MEVERENVQTEPKDVDQSKAAMAVGKKFPTSIMALSSLGLAYGSLKTAMRRIRRATSLPKFRLPTTIRLVPKYLRKDYIKFPLLLLVLLAATRLKHLEFNTIRKMDALIDRVRRGKNVALTAFQGAERSRFLLKSELNLLAPGPDQVKRIYHVVDSSRLVEKVYTQAAQMPFQELGIRVSKECEGFECGQAPDGRHVLFVCSLKCILDKTTTNATTDQCDDLVVFDGITLENLEGSCCDAIPADAVGPKLPSVIFNKIRRRSFVFACNLPLTGLSAELGVEFEYLTGDLNGKNYSVKSELLLRDHTGGPFKFGGLNYQGEGDAGNKQRLHEETGKRLKSLAATDEAGRIVVFFPSYGKMVEYHNAWKQLGIMDQLGMPYGRENRADDQFKNSLLQFAKEDKFTFLCSIRYHKEEDLAEFVMSQASVVMFVGLPYPFMNDIWDERIRYNNEHQGVSGRLNGQDLHKFRAIEFLNGIVKRCLNEYRYKNVHFDILDEALEGHSDKLADELGLVKQ